MRLHEGASASPAPGDPTARERNADATRADLLRAAKRRFTVYGFERTTVREIATDAGANVSLINRYFGSKDGLLAAVLAETAQALDGPTTDGAADPQRIVGDLLANLRPDAWPEFGNEHPLTLLLRDVPGDAATGDLRRRTLTAVIDRFAADIETSDVPSEEARIRAAVLFALVTGVVSLHSALPADMFGDADSTLLREVLTDVARAITDPADRT